MLSERDARSPRSRVPSSSLVLRRHSRHMPSITRTTEREAHPPNSAAASAKGKRSGGADTPLPSRERERERQIVQPAARSAAGRAVTTAASTAAGSAPRLMSIAQPVAEPEPQLFALRKRSHSRILGRSEKLDQVMKKTRTLRRCISCNVTPEDGCVNGSASGCAKRALMEPGKAALVAPQLAVQLTTPAAAQKVPALWLNEMNANVTHHRCRGSALRLTPFAGVLQPDVRCGPLALHLLGQHHAQLGQIDF